MKAFTIDAFEFGRLKEQRDGEFAVAELARLAEECADNSGNLRWTIAGGMHPSGAPQLVIEVTGTVQLICQRCLKPFAFDIDSASTLILANDEAHADQLEEMLDDDALDVIVGSKTTELQQLVEDEALLAIPQSPRHAQCPAGAVPAQEPEQEAIVVKPSPFAVLKDLKH